MRGPPPNQAIVEWREASDDVRQYWPEGSRWALGGLLAYEDVNGNGVLDLIDHDDPGTIDRPVGAKPDFVIGWAEGGLPSIPFIRGEVKLGYNLFKVPTCLFSPHEEECSDEDREMLVLNDDVLLELEPVEGTAFNYMMCAAQAVEGGGGGDRTEAPFPPPSDWGDEGHFLLICDDDGRVTFPAECSTQGSLCFGERQVCTHDYWDAPASDADRKAWPCEIEGWCDEFAIRNPCELTDTDTIGAHEPGAGWLASGGSRLWWTVDDGRIRSAPIEGGQIVDVHSFDEGGGWFVSSGDHMWTAGKAADGQQVIRSPLGGGPAEVIHTYGSDIELASHSVADGEGGVYWLVQTRFRRHEIHRFAAAGPEKIADAAGEPRGLALHDGTLWWKDRDSGEIVRQPRTPGSAPSILLTSEPGRWLGGVGGGFVYFVSTIPGTVFHRLSKASVETGEVEVLVDDAGWVNDMILQDDGLWWGDSWGGRIGRDREVVRRAPENVGIAVLPDRICWSDPARPSTMRRPMTRPFLTLGLSLAVVLGGCLDSQQLRGGGGAGGASDGGVNGGDGVGGGALGDGKVDGGFVDGGGFDAGPGGGSDVGTASVGDLGGDDPCAGVECDDGIGCTVDVCSLGECRAVPDHDRCNAGDLCIPADGGCVAAADCQRHSECVVDDPCQVGVCRAETGRCTTIEIDLDGDGETPRACGGSDCDDDDPNVIFDCPGTDEEPPNEGGDEGAGDFQPGEEGGQDGEEFGRDEGGGEEGDEGDEGGEEGGDEDPPLGPPELVVVTGGDIEFQGVEIGDSRIWRIFLFNGGGGTLTIERIDLVNSPDGDFEIAFSEDSPHRALPARLAGDDGDDVLRLDVTYRPQRAGQARGEIRIRSNDPAAAEVVVPLVGRSDLACVQVRPVELNFPGVPIGGQPEQEVFITNCGNERLRIERIELVDGTSADFQVVERPPLPFVLEGNVSATFTVRYSPLDEGADGGRLAISTNVPGFEVVEINLFGRAVLHEPPDCVAEARIAGAPQWDLFPSEEDLLETIPLKTLELRSAGEQVIEGQYTWTVASRPEDSISRILPFDGAQEVTLFLDLAGLYVIDLEITDALGAACDAAHVVVHAVPDEDIHVQLVWDTPADPDQGDHGFGAGSDVDLHLKHPLGDWFCAPRDCYYANPNPDWGVPFDQSDDPSVDIDDTDGAGPENINLNHPENNRVYRVGVHYFNDHGYGPSFATIRVFIQGRLHFELANKRLRGTNVFWDVATIAWPSGAITPIDQLYDGPPNEDCR